MDPWPFIFIAFTLAVGAWIALSTRSPTRGRRRSLYRGSGSSSHIFADYGGGGSCGGGDSGGRD